MILRKNDRPETFLALKKGHEAEKKLLCTDKIQKKCCLRARPVSLIDLIHDGRHVGFAIILQISYTCTSEEANNTNSRGYNEHLSHADDLFHVH